MKIDESDNYDFLYNHKLQVGPFGKYFGSFNIPLYPITLKNYLQQVLCSTPISLYLKPKKATQKFLFYNKFIFFG